MPNFFGCISDGIIKAETNNDIYTLSSKMVFTPSAGTHLLLYKGSGRAETASDNHAEKFSYENGGAEVTIIEMNPESDSGGRDVPFASIKSVSLSAVESILYGKMANPLGSANCPIISNEKMFAWDASHQYAESNDQSQQADSSTYTDKTTLTFTPASTQNYLLIWTAEISNSSASYDCLVQFDIDGATAAQGNFEPNNGGDFYPVSGIKVISLDTNSHTFKIKFKTENNAGTAAIQNARIVAIPIGSYSIESDEGADAAPGASFANMAEVTFTPTAGWHLIIASAEFPVASSGRINVDGTVYDLIESITPPDVSNYTNVLSLAIVNLAATSQTIAYQGLTSSTVRKPRIAVIDINGDISQITRNFKQSINASDNDGHLNTTDGNIEISAADIHAGKGGTGSGDINHMLLRYTDVTIPKDTDILEAYVWNINDAVVSIISLVLRVYGIDEDNTAAFSTYADANGRALTTAYADWTSFTSLTINVPNITPDISAVIEEITSRESWASGNALGIEIRDNGSGDDDYLQFEDFVSDPNEVGHIFIRWNETVSEPGPSQNSNFFMFFRP